MSALPLFGSLLDLPVFAGNYSDCERELVELLRQIDAVVMQEQMHLIHELQDIKMLCDIQKEEIESLRLTLRAEGKAIPTPASTKLHEYESRLASKQSEQIRNLKAENANLKKQITSVLLNIPSEELKEMNVQEVVINLQEQIQDLKAELDKRNHEKHQLKKQHEHLLTLITNLKAVTERQRREISPLEKFPTLGKQIEEMLIAAFRKSMDEDDEDVRKIEEKFQNQVIAWANDLTRSE